jgi:hypothetical protein
MFANAAKGAQGLADVLASIANTNMPLTQGQFDAFGQQAQSAYEQAKEGALAAGLTEQQATTQALIAIAPLLSNLAQIAAKYGIELDDNTKALLEQAKEAGLAFPEDPILSNTKALKDLTDVLRGLSGHGDGSGGGGGSAPDWTGPVPVHQDYGQGEATGTPGLGVVNYGAGQWNMLHGKEVVLPENRINEFVAAHSGNVSTGPISVTVLAGNQDPTAVGNAVATALERKLVPRLVTAMKG